MEILIYLISVLLIGLITEKLMCYIWRKNIKYVIHVNGVRGKSTVVRMIDAAFKENGMHGIAKTTGSEASVVMPEGDIRAIKRKTNPNIREQRRILKMASSLRCEYLIIECMAVNPKLQLQCEKMLNSDVSVITNVKVDHIGILGYTKDEIAKSLLNVKPKDGVLITDDFYSEIDDSHVIKKKFYTGDDAYACNANTALSVCEHFNIDIEKSKKAISNYTMDIGQRDVYELQNGEFINGFSANDYDSTKEILLKYKDSSKYDKAIILNNRPDRHYRLLLMLDLIKEYDPKVVYITGSGTWYAKRKLNSLGYSGDIIVTNKIDDIVFEGFTFIGIGNIKGFGIDLIEGNFLC